MEPNGYAYQLRSLRALEMQKRRDFTDQAMAVYDLRLKSIDAEQLPPDQRLKAISNATRQWTVFMQRDMRAVG